MMRLRALRVADVGRFKEPVAVERMGDGLNVLSGPNELGKSTLMAALAAVLTYDHKSMHGDIKQLVPNGGGAPLIEVEFEVDGRRWRVRKRFASSRAALLVDSASGAVLKNADAETRLAELLAGPPDLERFRFLWVRQGDSLEAIKDNALGSGLSGLLESEIDAVVLDARARAVQQAVGEALAPLRTARTGRPAAGGAWAASIAALTAAETALAVASQRHAEQQDRLDELAKAYGERADLMEPAAVAARAEGVNIARVRLAAAQAAAQNRRLADEQKLGALAKLQAAEQASATLDAVLAEFKRLAAEAATADRDRAGLQLRHADAVAAIAAGEAMHATRAAAVAEAESALTAARMNARAIDAMAVRDQLAERIDVARAAEVALADSRAIARGLAAVTETGVAHMRQVERALAGLDAAFAAAVPEVTVEPAPGQAILVDGRALTGAAVLHPEVPLVIEIAGGGRITIAPNPAAVSAEKRSERAVKKAAMTAALAALGAGTLSEAEARLGERRAVDTVVREAQARLTATAPLGLEALLADHAEAAHRAAGAMPAATAVSEIEILLEAARRAYASSAATLRAAEQAGAAVASEVVRFEATAASRDAQMAALTQRHGAPAVHADLRQTADDELQRCRVAFMDMTSAAEAFAAHPDVARLPLLASDLAAKESAHDAAAARAGALDRVIAALEGALRAAGDEDVVGSAERAQAAHSRAVRDHAEIVLDVRSLSLLEATFAGLAAAGQAELSAPVRARIAPYLKLVFPDGALSFGAGLAPALLDRGGSSEALGQLSRGTREQIAILVRLGLARLLVDRGAGVPLLLDDALVYADDGRIAQMFEALAVAAQVSQVIVLTCRAQTFAALGGRSDATELRLTSWSPD